jgi:hypothetical protein
MAYTLQQIRQYIWDHLDLDSTELPTNLLDTWAREASVKITNARTRWPFFEQDWELTTVAGQRDYPFSAITPTPDQITSVMGYQRRLAWIGRDEAERRYLPSQTGNGIPVLFSTWNAKLRLYPYPTAGETLSLRGYRQPIDWVSQGAGAVPDFPDDFHDLIRQYVLSMSYAHQEDTQLAQMYRGFYTEELARLVKMYGDVPQAYPLVIGSGPRLSQRNRLLFPFEF